MHLFYLFNFFQIIGVDHVYFIQKNSLNLRSRTLDIEAYNESFQSRVVVLETCRYFVSILRKLANLKNLFCTHFNIFKLFSK